MDRPTAKIAAWLGSPPSIVLVLLMATQTLRPWEGVAGLMGCAAWSVAAGALLARDIRRFSTDLTAQDQEKSPLYTPGLSRLARTTAQALEAERCSRDAIAASADFCQALLDRLPDALFQLDGGPGTRRVVWCNPAARQTYGAEVASLLRHPVLRAAIIDAETAIQPIRATLSLAAPIPRDLDAVVIRAGTLDRPAPLFLLLGDRTHERELDRMRADFVANASHELRTPLTSLIGFIETLRGPALGDTEALTRFLRIMAEQAERMQRIITDLLSLSRIEMTEHQPPTEPADIAALLRQIASFMEPILHDGNVALTLGIPDGLPSISGDGGQLTQVFGNLIDNAVKYSAIKHEGAGGEIAITVSSTPDDDFPGPGILITVADNGPGIAREHLPRLTERFYRADKGRLRAVGGTGLGLSIAKHVISRHRGRLVIDSIEGRGTTCRVWLPSRPIPSPGIMV